MHSRRPLVALALLAGLGAVTCKNTQTTGTGRTERERDSVIGQSNVPGAGAVQKALEVSDSSRSRVAAEDSAASAP